LAIQEALVGFLMDEVLIHKENIIMTAIQLTDSPPGKAKWDKKLELNDILNILYEVLMYIY
jgi:hypothetical protein